MRYALATAGLVAAGVIILFAAGIGAEPRPRPVVRRDVPCAGCILRLPAPSPGRAFPLVVALHGDNGSPARLVELLQPEADRRGFAVLALACPQKLGCDHRSFWQWGGAPSWLSAQVDALAAPPSSEPSLAWSIDPQQVYLLAWSGGASYVTDVMAELPPRFAAVALLGGGMPSRHGGACARCRVPIYYAIGERNPLGYLARAARDTLRSCGHPLREVVLPGADHEGEWAALSHGKIAEVLSFFAAQPLSCPSP
jgi:poly(3-hydroxybutyrate) depolymerase